MIACWQDVEGRPQAMQRRPAGLVALSATLVCWLLLGYLAVAQGAQPASDQEVIRLNDEAVTLINSGKNYVQAEALLERALARAERTEGPEIVAIILNNLADVTFLQARYAEAEAFARRALTILQQKDIPPTSLVRVKIFDILARISQVLSRYAEAEAFFQKALSIQKPLPETSEQALEQARILHNLGLLYRGLARLPQAMEIAQQALAIAKRVVGMEHAWTAMILQDLAGLYGLQNRYTEAEALYQKALTIQKKVLRPGHPDLALTLFSLAMFYEHLDRNEEAEVLTQRVRTMLEEVPEGHFLFKAVILYNLGEHSRKKSHYAQAETLIQQALTIANQILPPRHLFRAWLLRGLGRLHQAQRQYAQAEMLYQQALKIDQELVEPDHLVMSFILKDLGLLYRDQGQDSRAETLLRKVLAIQERFLGWQHEEVMVTLNNLAALLVRSNQAEARRLYERARRIQLTLRRMNGDLEEGGSRGILQTASSSLYAYAKLLSDMARTSGPDHSPTAAALDAFVVAEQVRWGAVQATLDKVAARTAIRDPAVGHLAKQVQELRLRQQALWRQMTDASSQLIAPHDVKRLEALRLIAEQVTHELDKATQRLYQAFPQYKALANFEPIDAPAVKTMLQPDEALLSYIALDDRLLVWLVRPDRAPVYLEIHINKGDLVKLVLRLHNSLKLGWDFPFDIIGAQTLYDLLLGRLRPQLEGVTHLILVPDEVLFPLPFAVLVTEAAGSPQRPLESPDLARYAQLPWLVKDFALTVLPSATSLRALRQRASLAGTTDEPFIGIGDPVLSGHKELPPIPGTRKELLAIAAALGADPRSSVYLGDQATETVVRALNASGRLSQAGILAFATHTSISESQHAPPALVLTPPVQSSAQDDGLLALDEILELKLRYQYVILSACETASADNSGESLSGLARAFFFAGASALLVSHWNVDDLATQELISEIFRRQARDRTMSHAEALRQGMLGLLSRARGKRAHFAHPYAWAPFFIVGGMP